MGSGSRFDAGRHAGVIVPLFSIPSERSWGIGEIPDLARFASWLADAGLDVVQLLPVNEMSDGQSSPYSAISAMAIDPIYIALEEVPEFQEAGGEASLSSDDRAQLARARQAGTVQYGAVRPLKRGALEAAFELFDRTHVTSGTERADAFRAFCARQAWWLDEYALFRTLHDEHDARYWLEWEPSLRDREPQALAAARTGLATRIRFFSWLQWVAGEQWQRARAACGSVGIFGDFPFMVSGDSADVWSRQHEFRVDASVGVPPDAFSDTGQDWGLPAYRWDVMEPGGYEWLRQRVDRCADLFDGYRVDHLVGFYRTFVRERDDSTSFFPADEAEQRAQGERLLEVFRSGAARIIVEDLGTVPDFVRASLATHHVAGLKVLRWEREWQQDGQPFKDPAGYAPDSVATSGTHDTETLAEWWDAAAHAERARALELAALRGRGFDVTAPYSPELRDALLETLFGAGSDFLLIPVQDLFGWRDRVNTPAVVSEENWSWRLPWPLGAFHRQPEARERAAFLRELARRHHRSSL